MCSTNYGEALQNVPLFLSSGAMMQVLVVGTFFDEFQGFDELRMLALSSGFCLQLTGMIVTSLAPHYQSPPKEAEPCIQVAVDERRTSTASSRASISSNSVLESEPRHSIISVVSRHSIISAVSEHG